jgi:hypothetical protein
MDIRCGATGFRLESVLKNIVAALLALVFLSASASASAQALSRYAFGKIKAIEVVEASGISPQEDKSFLDCTKVLVNESDVRFAIKHARAVSKRFFEEELVSFGCHGYAKVTLTNGDVVGVHLQPSGRVMYIPEKGRFKGKTFYYGCERCGEQLTERARAK